MEGAAVRPELGDLEAAFSGAAPQFAGSRFSRLAETVDRCGGLAATSDDAVGRSGASFSRVMLFIA
jgi:hypothetical protein